MVTSLIVFLFGFSKQRNKQRKIHKITLDFKDENRMFITPESVNKLLILNSDTLTSIGKETLVLKEMEKRLLENPMIKAAEVYVTIDGVLGVKLEQRNPIARVKGSPDFYLDEDGKKMPMSSVHSARVPIISGLNEDYFLEVTHLVNEISKDEFMKEYVVGMDVDSNGEIKLIVRKNNFKVLFGKSEDIENKFQKFKAFYKLTKQDSLLESYGLVNLKFANQVVATKWKANGE